MKHLLQFSLSELRERGLGEFDEITDLSIEILKRTIDSLGMSNRSGDVTVLGSGGKKSKIKLTQFLVRVQDPEQSQILHYLITIQDFSVTIHQGIFTQLKGIT